MRPLRRITALTVLSAFAAAAAMAHEPAAAANQADAKQATPGHAHHGGCDSYTWDLTREITALEGRTGQVAAGARASEAPRIEPGTRYDLALHPQSSVDFVAEPRKPATGDATAGHVRFQVPEAGRHRVAITTRHRIDVFDAGRELATLGFQGRPGCERMNKVVEFDLPAGRDLVLQFASGHGDTAGVVITRVPPAGATADSIRSDELARHLRVLASDEFEGRAPDTTGEGKTIAYIAREFEAAGLEPAGDDGTWLQAVTLERSEIRGDVATSFSVAGRAMPLANGEDIALESLHPAPRVDLAGVPLVFAGYGITAPELGWDDYAGLDVTGKVVVVLVNDPDFETAPGKFGGRAMTWYGRWAYKYLEAAKRGAAGVLIVHETEPAAYPWATVRNGRAAPQFDIVRDDAASHHLRVRGWIQRATAERLFAAAGLDYDAAKRAAQQQGFEAHALGDARFSAAFDVERSRITSHNVAGLLRGAERPGETVILSGHWDGYGIGEPDASGDAIMNAAVDNATAIASLIEIARVMAEAPRPARSVLFLALTAEESGLLGATHYAANPLRPLATTAAALNLEMWSPDGATRDISSWGLGKVSLERDLVAAAEAMGRTYSPDPDLEAGFFYRADHFAFAQAGVPAITIGPGMDQLEGGVEGGRAARADYFAKRYHQPDDEFDDSWDMRGPTADTEVVLRLARTLAESEAWPAWDEGSEFRAAREASAGARPARGSAN